MKRLPAIEPDARSDGRQGWSPHYVGALAIAFVLCAAFYLWTADAFRLPWVQSGGDAFFARLAKAFLHRQTSLLDQPPAEMVALRNPYDPAENYKYRLHDASYYNGKYYLYWGVSPTLLWYLPVRALTGRDGCDVAACSIFSIGGLLFYFLLLDVIRRDHFPTSSVTTAVSLALLLAFGNAVPFTLRRPVVYESSILCGYMLTGAFLYLAYKAAFRGALRSGYLFASAVTLALLFLCRSNQAACGMVIAAGLFLHRQPSLRSRSNIARLLAISCIPMGIAIAAQALYNFARFHSVFEYGLKYQLGVHMRQSSNVSLERAPFGLLYYLFSIPRFSPLFPFLKAMAGPSNQPLTALSEILDKHAAVFLGVEPVAGILFGVPLLLLNGLAIFLLKDPKVRVELRVFFVAVLAAALVFFAFDLCFYGPTMRYEVDFLPALLLPTVTLALWLDRRGANQWWRPLFLVGLPVMVAYSVFVSAAISVSGYNDGLLLHDPGRFNALTRFFSPVERLLAP